MKRFRWLARSVSPAFLRRAAIRLAASTLVMATLNAVAHNETDRPIPMGERAPCSHVGAVPAEKGDRLCRRGTSNTFANEVAARTLLALTRSAGISWLAPSPSFTDDTFLSGRWRPLVEEVTANR